MELSSNLPTEGLTFAEWNYEGEKLVDGDRGVVNNPFGTRLESNQKKFSLTLKNLIPGDSGEFSLVSAIKGQQRETVIITLHVQGKTLLFLTSKLIIVNKTSIKSYTVLDV